MDANFVRKALLQRLVELKYFFTTEEQCADTLTKLANAKAVITL